MPKIRMIVLDGDLTVEEIANLTNAFRAPDVNFTSVALPNGVTAQAATLSKGEDKPRPRPMPVPAEATVAPAPAPAVITSTAPTPAPQPVPTAAEVIQQTLAVDSEPAPAPAPAAPVAGGRLSEVVLMELAAAKKLRDVVERMRVEGITAVDDIVAEARTIRTAIPILSRIGAEQIEDRVRRTYEAL
jgi:hypothetical protein